MKRVLSLTGILILTITLSSCQKDLNSLILDSFPGSSPVVSFSLGLVRDKDDCSEYTVQVLNDEQYVSEVSVVNYDKIFNETEIYNYPLASGIITLKRTDEVTPLSCKLRTTIRVPEQELDYRQRICFHLRVINNDELENSTLIDFDLPFVLLDPDISCWNRNGNYFYDFMINVSNNTIMLEISD